MGQVCAKGGQFSGAPQGGWLDHPASHHSEPLRHPGRCWRPQRRPRLPRRCALHGRIPPRCSSITRILPTLDYSRDQAVRVAHSAFDSGSRLGSLFRTRTIPIAYRGTPLWYGHPHPGSARHHHGVPAPLQRAEICLSRDVGLARFKPRRTQCLRLHFATAPGAEVER